MLTTNPWFLDENAVGCMESKINIIYIPFHLVLVDYSHNAVFFQHNQGSKDSSAHIQYKQK